MLSEPVVGKNFFGREEILSLLDKRTKAMEEGYRQNVAITGQSLAGKSSLLQHFLYNSLRDTFLPIYVEVFKEDFPSFANKFIATLLYNSLKAKEEPACEGIGELLSKAERFFPKTAHAAKEVLALIEKSQLDEAYVNLLGLTSVAKEETSKSCIVILDEFDNISYFRIKNPFLQFGKVIMVQKDTMYIISSSRNSAVKKILQEKLSLLFGNFETVEVRGFDARTSAAFLSKKANPFSADEDVTRFLTYFTGGNPFYIEQIVREAKNIMREKSRTQIDLESIEEAILNLVYASNGTVHQYLNSLLLELLDTKSREALLKILCSIACGSIKQRAIARDLRRSYSDVSHCLSLLIDLGLVSKNGVFYMVSDSMLSFWLEHVHVKRQQMLVNYIVDKTRVYREDIHAYVSDFLQESKKSVLERAYELFHLFANDIVEIEDKKLLLPQCDKVEIKTFDDITPYIVASSKKAQWICQIFEHTLGDLQISEFVKNLTSLEHKVARKIVVPVYGVEENTRLLAKELRILTWDLETMNMLLRLYNRKGIVVR